jgi:hypothetical protein
MGSSRMCAAIRHEYQRDYVVLIEYTHHLFQGTRFPHLLASILNIACTRTGTYCLCTLAVLNCHAESKDSSYPVMPLPEGEVWHFCRALCSYELNAQCLSLRNGSETAGAVQTSVGRQRHRSSRSQYASEINAVLPTWLADGAGVRQLLGLRLAGVSAC